MATTYPSSYSSVLDVYALSPEIGSVTNITSRDIQYFIGQAELMMNAKISDLYSLPFVGTNIPQLSMISNHITVYNLYAHRIYSHHTKEQSDIHLAKYKHAFKILDSVAEGSTPLIDDTFAVIPIKSESTHSVWTNNSDDTPTFNERSFLSQEVDDDG